MITKKKLKYISRSTSTAILTFSLLISHERVLFAGKYADIFTKDIYDQAKALSGPLKNHSDKEKDEELIIVFSQAKKEALKQYISKKQEELIKQLKPIIPQPTLLKILAEIGADGLMLTGNAQYIGAGCVAQGVLKKYFPDNPIGSTLAAKIDTLIADAVELENGLSHEPIHTLEKQYVIHKRNMDDERLKDEIENAFLSLCKLPSEEQYEDNALKLFILNALKLPIEIRVPFTNSPHNKSRQILAKIEQSQFINNLDKDIKKSLEAMMEDICKAAAAKERRNYFIWGNSSCGKSTLAVEIPKLLDLPYGVLSLTNPTNFEKTYLEGIHRYSPSPEPGKIAEILMNPKGTTKPAKTTVLIINDLHSVSPEKHENVYSYLLDFLDPRKEEYFNPYFNTDIGISSLITIITSNKKLENNDKNKPLLSRFSLIINLPDLSNNTLENEADKKIEKIVKSDYCLSSFSFTYHAPSSIEIGYREYDNVRAILRPIQNQLTQKITGTPGLCFTRNLDEPGQPDIDMRQLVDMGRLSYFISKFKMEITHLSIDYLKQAENEKKAGRPAENLYMLAALCGHEDANYELASLRPNDKTPMGSPFWLREAGLLGSGKACYELASQIPDQRQYWLEKAAGLGSAEAKRELSEKGK